MMAKNIHDMASIYIVNVHLLTIVDGYFSYNKTSQFQMFGLKFEG